MTNINYGSTLQCYALQRYLQKRGHLPEHLRDYRANPFLILKRLKNIKYFRLFFAKAKAQMSMQHFIKKYITLSKYGYFTEKAMFKHCPKVDCFIAGSDQIWRNANGSRYLNFAPDNAIKISYAASFGMEKIPSDMEEQIRKWLARLNGISVRENTAVEMVENLVGKKALKLIDPTLLIDGDEYPYVQVEKENYCYCYFLNLNSKRDVCFEAIEEFTLAENLELLITAPSNYNLFLDKNPIFPSVEEWLGYYKNADCIVTNTYHGMLFCIIFKKQFLFFAQEGRSEKENDRFYSLMSMLNLEDRLITREDVALFSKKMQTTINYEKVYSILRSERIRTNMFFEEYGI